ncbi:MAG: YihY/virulence factor BrkB family protein [Opitutaceae bacterium]
MATASTSTEKPTATPADAQEGGRGRNAESPSDVPKAGWLDILARTKQQLGEDNLTIVAAGVAFYGFVAVVPALAATVAIYGLMADPSQVADQIAALATVLPGETLPLLRDQMIRITSNDEAAGIGAIVGLLIAIYSSANATKALISGLNIAYDETEKRSFFKLSGIAIVLTIVGIIAAALAIALVAVLPSVLTRLHITHGVERLLTIVRWPLLVGGYITSLAVLYRYGPCRDDARWKWVSPGAIVAGVLWLIGSGAFSLYVAKFASYDKTYGPLGAVVVFLMWLYISALTVLIGAEFNSEMERQTKRDTTEGPEKPLGQRGANSADTVGPSREELRAPKKK